MEEGRPEKENKRIVKTTRVLRFLFGFCRAKDEWSNLGILADQKPITDVRLERGREARGIVGKL